MPQPVTWSSPPSVPQARPAEIHLWRVWLGGDPEPYQAVLSADERARAARFHFSKDRDRFMVGRGALRGILGRYLGAPPAKVAFDYSPYGKPSLAGRDAHIGLSFNLSHARDLMLLAVSQRQALGLDVEALRDVAYLEIAEQMFAPEEYRALVKLPGAARQEAFFACWTRKEAYIKARGAGLSHPLDSFVVSLVPGVPAALLATRENPQEAACWSLLGFCPWPGFVAALAVRTHGWRLECWETSVPA